MHLFLSIEAQNATDIGLAKILNDVTQTLKFITAKDENLEAIDNYGTEFYSIGIIPTCVDKKMLSILGWKERKLISRKKREADIRLFMDYDKFVKENEENKKLMFVSVIIKSIEVIIEKSKGDFRGEKLIEDILDALKISREQLQKVETEDGSVSPN